jgi:alpha-D-ribose 1-methylphosphonate 5-triphosphate synthase subunit PhnI
MRFRRALDRANVAEALSSASELEHVDLCRSPRALPAASRESELAALVLLAGEGWGVPANYSREQAFGRSQR